MQGGSIHGAALLYHNSSQIMLVRPSTSPPQFKGMVHRWSPLLAGLHLPRTVQAASRPLELRESLSATLLCPLLVSLGRLLSSRLQQQQMTCSSSSPGPPEVWERTL